MGVQEGWVSGRSWHVHVRRWGGTRQTWTDRRGGSAGCVCVCSVLLMECRVSVCLCQGRHRRGRTDVVAMQVMFVCVCVVCVLLTACRACVSVCHV